MATPPEPQHELLCANWTENKQDCSRVGKFACNGCRLVMYCGPGCQKSHWSVHKPECRSAMSKPTWRPRWESENRPPAFVGFDPAPFVPFNNRRKYLWGNVPALDVLNLEKNEGGDFGGDLRLLFAASGDIRNVVKTITSLPESYRGRLSVVMNDRDEDVVARNVLMLLLALEEKDPRRAAEGIIHLWYSALLPQSLVDVLQGPIRQRIRQVCDAIESREEAAVLAKTWDWDGGQRTLCVVLTKRQWFGLLDQLEPPAHVTAEMALANMRAVTLAPARVDYRERFYFSSMPQHRPCLHKFRSDGLLLPFGAPRGAFTVPNPTIFRDAAASWPLKDNANPLEGWALPDVLATATGPATHDLYGKLSAMLERLLVRFHGRLRALRVSFEMHNVDVQMLDQRVRDRNFDRVEVSNIVDDCYLGMAPTLAHTRLFLADRRANPHATLIALFMNAVDDTETQADKMANTTAQILRVVKYLPVTNRARMSKNYDAENLRRSDAKDWFRDNDKYFKRYMQQHRFAELAEVAGMVMKPEKKHTVVEPWPFRLKKKPGEAGAQEEFLTMLASTVSGCERYVEWRWK